MGFRGWPAEAMEFFEGLEADNSKTYWHDHKSVYEECVRGPMDALLAELAGDFGAGKVFRPFRDVRFSADKSPYKTHIGATLAGGGYVQLSADGLGVGSGMYTLSPDQLDRYRRAVAEDSSGVPLAALVAKLTKAGVEVTAHESLRTAPRGYAKDHPRIDLLRQKGLIAWRRWEPAAWLGTKQAKSRIVELLGAAKPLNDWLATHVGPSQAAPPQR